MGRKMFLEDEDDAVDPLKGPKGDTAFLRSNYQFMTVGGSFRTVKAQFSPALIKSQAKKAGWTVRIDDEDPWVRVTITGKIPKVKI